MRGAADYHDQTEPHWIDDHIATPMARYPEYRASRRSFGLDVLGSLVVEVEADDGTVGVAITTGGSIGAWIVEHHLARFVEGAPVAAIERIWDQLYLSTLHYGRKGIVLNAISGVDLALWDLLGKVRGEPVHALLGGPVRDEITFYATGPDPAAAARLGFIGCKVPLQHGPAEGDDGVQATVDRLRSARATVGDDFWLMLDCWMDGAKRTRRRAVARRHGDRGRARTVMVNTGPDPAVLPELNAAWADFDPRHQLRVHGGRASTRHWSRSG